MAQATVQTDDSEHTPGMQPWVRVVLVGLGLGVLYWVLARIVQHLFVTPILCRSMEAPSCSNVLGISGDIATILVALIGTFVLVRLTMFRPLLVAIATACILWGLSLWTEGLAWGEALLWSAGLYGLAYVTFSWILRSTRFYVAIGIVIAVIVATRLIITA